MSIQVINSAGNVLWTTDKAEIDSNSTDVTYQVFATGLGTAAKVVVWRKSSSAPGKLARRLIIWLLLGQLIRELTFGMS